MTANLVGQAPFELRGANDARLRALEAVDTAFDTRLDTLEAANVTPYMLAANAGVGSTASASTVDYPGPVEKTFTKRQAATSLVVTGSVGAYKGVNAGSVDIALRIDSVDYTLAGFFFNDLNSHRAIPVNVAIAAGLAAGTYTARLRWRTTNDGVASDANDKVYLSITERTVG